MVGQRRQGVARGQADEPSPVRQASRDQRPDGVEVGGRRRHHPPTSREPGRARHLPRPVHPRGTSTVPTSPQRHHCADAASRHGSRVTHERRPPRQAPRGRQADDVGRGGCIPQRSGRQAGLVSHLLHRRVPEAEQGGWASTPQCTRAPVGASDHQPSVATDTGERLAWRDRRRRFSRRVLLVQISTMPANRRATSHGSPDRSLLL